MVSAKTRTWLLMGIGLAMVVLASIASALVLLVPSERSGFVLLATAVGCFGASLVLGGMLTAPVDALPHGPLGLQPAPGSAAALGPLALRTALGFLAVLTLVTGIVGLVTFLREV